MDQIRSKSARRTKPTSVLISLIVDKMVLAGRVSVRVLDIRMVTGAGVEVVVRKLVSVRVLVTVVVCLTGWAATKLDAARIKRAMKRKAEGLVGAIWRRAIDLGCD